MIFKEYDLITKDDISPEAFNDLKKFASYEENYSTLMLLMVVMLYD